MLINGGKFFNFLANLIKLIRYRFLLIAGILPYCLGNAIAFYQDKSFSLYFFILGFIGILFVLIGVEAINEYFDWRIGTDRVFQLNPKPVTITTFIVGMTAFFVAFIIAVILTFEAGLYILIFSILGFLASFFYLGVPIKLAYRGLGEITIAVSYGPLMVLGSYYLQTQKIDIIPLLISFLPAILVFGIAILNEVVDFYQDRLVGKKNICVRLGKKNTVELYRYLQVFFYIILVIELLTKILPLGCLTIFVCLPISLKSCAIARNTYEYPHQFISAIRYNILTYLIVLILLNLSYLLPFNCCWRF